jgi:hypothetical protein
LIEGGSVKEGSVQGCKYTKVVEQFRHVDVNIESIRGNTGYKICLNLHVEISVYPPLNGSACSFFEHLTDLLNSRCFGWIT